MSALRVVFFGTPDIAVPTLEALIAGSHDVVGVVSQPDRGRGRGRKRSPSAVSEVALREGLPLFRPEKVGDAETVDALDALRPDVGVVVAFGQFIPKKVRELPSRGYLINAHASLLPKYRGAAPIARAILDGEQETGISVMRVEKEMDAGAVALVATTPIDPAENAAELTTRLGSLAADAIAEAVDRIALGTIAWTEQDAAQATFAAKIEKHDAILDLRNPASALTARIHAVSPKPGGALTLESRGAAPVVLKVSRAEWRAFEAAESETPPGTVETGATELRIATGEGWLVPRTLQRPGGKALPVADFLRGFPLPSDARFALVDSRANEGSDSA